MNKVNTQQNVSYYGVFKGSIEAVCGELSKYDALLFPTKWDIEGVQGILVEEKIAGLAEIVTNHNYNSEIVENCQDEIVLKNNAIKELIEAILLCSRKSGYIENYEAKQQEIC